MDLPTKDYDLPSSLNCWRKQEEVEVFSWLMVSRSIPLRNQFEQLQLFHGLGVVLSNKRNIPSIKTTKNT